MTAQIGLWAGAAALALAVAVALRRPLKFLGTLLLRSGLGLGALWLFNQAGSLIGVTVGLNLVSALTVGLLGAPGFGLLLMGRWLL